MAKKHKTKQTQHDQQKLVAAHRRNEFLYKLRNLINALTGDPAVFRMLDKRSQNIMNSLRINALRIEAAPGHDVDPKVHAVVKEVLTTYMRNATVPFTRNGPKVSLDLYFSIGMSLFLAVNSMPDDAFPKAKAFKKALAMLQFANDDLKTSEIMEVFIEKLEYLCDMTSNLIDAFPNSVHWVEYQMMNTGIRESHYFQITIYAYHPKRKHFIIDDISRPSFEVCYAEPFEGLHLIDIDDKQLGQTDQPLQKTYPVYVQSHALNRISERLDRVGIELIREWFSKSLIECKAFKDKNGTYFIEFNFNNKKVGYLLAGLHDEHLLIHTFLFITNNGTPEGNRLLAKTGLGKLDKSYLNIDKLSTFYKTDIADNPEVKAIFVEAGCAEVFELPEYIYQQYDSDHKIPLADKIKAYMTLNNQEMDYETYLNEQMPEI